jgi:D-arabinose 1-dehydrogenase-like Zn-dependent alcohol dehydrogenase
MQRAYGVCAERVASEWCIDRDRHAITQEMLDYCAAKNIVSDIEMIPVQKINDAYERVIKGDVKHRFVIDMKTL